MSSSSPTATPASPSRPERSGFSLAGPSISLDPRTHAVRPDLADVRLAARVFAPHYAAPLAQVIRRDVPLRIARPDDAKPIATLAAGTRFEVLEIAGDDAWGIAVAEGLVGYIDRAALEGQA